MHDAAETVSTPAADAKTSKPIEVKSAVQRAVVLASRRRRRGCDWS